MAKNLQKPQKMWFLRFAEPQYLLSAHLAVLVCSDHPKLPSYAISAKTNDSNSRKWPKTLKNRKNMRFLRFPEPQHFFLKIGLRHFSPLTSEQLHAKNLRNPMMGSMRTFVTDRLTDRRAWIHRTCPHYTLFSL